MQTIPVNRFAGPLASDHMSNKCSSHFLPLLFFAFLLGPTDGLTEDELPVDIPAPKQGEIRHSKIFATDDHIRDDELLNLVCKKINDNGGKVKDVKLMVNSCFGGGLLDDMERVFGPDGDCAGVPWVGGSASEASKPARAWKDSTVVEFDGDKNNDGNADSVDEKLGSTWTDALAGNSHFDHENPNNKTPVPGVIHNGSVSNNVLEDLQAAGQKDIMGPNGFRKEKPQVATGNRGFEIQWDMEGAKHEAILFSGAFKAGEELALSNSIDNMEAALQKTWKKTPHNIQAIKEGTLQNLIDAIETASKRLDENTQLLLYFTAHGGKLSDSKKPRCLGFFDADIFEPETCAFVVDDGWLDGLFGNVFSEPAVVPNPMLDLHIEVCEGCETWGYVLNGYPLEFPVVNSPPGEPFTAHLPLEYYQLRPGATDANVVEIIPPSPITSQAAGRNAFVPGGSLVLSGMDIDSGPISQLMSSQVLLPGQSAAFYDINRSGEGVFVELLDNGLAVAYVFSHNRDGSGQAWMAGLGEQIGNGIIVHELQMPIGASFGPGFDPGDVVRTDFGSLFFKLPTCGTSEVPGSLFIYPRTTTGYEDLQDVNYTQLDLLADCITGMGSASVTRSGSYFDPSHSGEGIIVQVLTNGLVVVMWFTYDKNGKQMWMQGTGTMVDGTLTVNNLSTTAGTMWGAGFDPETTMTVPWGSMTMVFSGCGSVKVDYVSTAGFGSGTLNMVRLTNLMGLGCTE